MCIYIYAYVLVFIQEFICVCIIYIYLYLYLYLYIHKHYHDGIGSQKTILILFLDLFNDSGIYGFSGKLGNSTDPYNGSHIWKDRSWRVARWLFGLRAYVLAPGFGFRP